MKKFSRILASVALAGAMLFGMNSCESDPVTLSVNPASLSFTAEGGTQTVTVTCNAAWTIESAPAWLTVTKGAKSFIVTAAANTGEELTGSITVKAKDKIETIEVKQAAAPAELTLTPPSLQFPAEGGTQTVTVTTNKVWTIEPFDHWISVTKGETSFDITLLAPNNGRSELTGSVTVKAGDKTETVNFTQAPTPELSVDTDALTFNWKASMAGAKTVTVDTNVSWTATPSDTWITVTSGTDSFTVSVTDNDANRKNGSVTVSAGGLEKTITVDQLLHADDLVGTWASTEYMYKSANAALYYNNHDVTITKIDDTTVKVANLMALTANFPTMDANSDTATITVNPQNGTVSLARQEMTPTIIVTGWPTYLCRLISATPSTCFTNPGFIDFPINAGYKIDWSAGNYQIATLSGTPVYGTFYPLSREPGTTVPTYSLGFYCGGSTWTKTSSEPAAATATKNLQNRKLNESEYTVTAPLDMKTLPQGLHK